MLQVWKLRPGVSVRRPLARSETSIRPRSVRFGPVRCGVAGQAMPRRSLKMRLFRCKPGRRKRSERWWWCCCSCGFCSHVRRCSCCLLLVVVVLLLLWIALATAGFESMAEPFELSAFLQSRLRGSMAIDADKVTPLQRVFTAPYSPLRSRNARTFIRGTSLRGKEVRRFWSHQDCFSQTGRWVLDETPRAMCCKVKVYHTANFTRCDYGLNFCNDTASGVVVYGSPLPASLAAKVRPWTSRKELKWFWQTSPLCPMLPFDRADFCKRIGRGRHLLISGDSISYQLFITFLNFLRSELSETQYPFHGVGFEPVCEDVLGDGGFNLAWVCSPLLNTTEVTQYIEEWNIEILLMNRGAWFRSDESFVAGLHQIVRVLQARYPHLLVVYRNTSPGHKGCVNLHGPLAAPQEKGPLPYHWGEFARQNEMAKRIIHRAHFVFMDVDSMLSLRPDGHMGPPRDCLHYSIPGPLDVVFYLFYNTFLLLA